MNAAVALLAEIDRFKRWQQEALKELPKVFCPVCQQEATITNHEPDFSNFELRISLFVVEAHCTNKDCPAPNNAFWLHYNRRMEVNE